jgi:hypothetical protein
MAQFCSATGMSPSEYKKLTLIEYMEFLKILNMKVDE